MSSSIFITKTCEHCSAAFTARKTTTRYCSLQCNRKAYKAQLRADKLSACQIIVPVAVRQRRGCKTLVELCVKELLTVSETARYLGVSRPTVYGYLQRGEVPSIRLGQKSFVSRVHLMQMFDSSSAYKARPNVEQKQMVDLYSSGEIEQRYAIKRTRVYEIAKEYGLPKIQIKGVVYFDKLAVDAYFAECQSESELYYTAAQVTNKYGISRDSLYKFISQYDIPKIRSGRYIKVSRVALDDLFNSLNKTTSICQPVQK